MKSKDLELHVRILGWINIASGLLFLAIGAFSFILFMGLGVVSGEMEAFAAMGLIGTFISFLMVLLAIPSIVAGVGLLKGKNWARMLVIVIGLLNLMNFPLGTAIGLYTIYVLLQNDASDYFASAKAI